jgi:hypothetical protein
METPRVLVLAAGPEALLREICAGIEEEGVPFEVLRADSGTAGNLAEEAARRSPLEVGVGLDRSGVISVHHSKLPAGKPVSRNENPTRQAARRAGHDAARIVTGVPLTPKENHS